MDYVMCPWYFFLVGHSL